MIKHFGMAALVAAGATAAMMLPATALPCSACFAYMADEEETPPVPAKELFQLAEDPESAEPRRGGRPDQSTTVAFDPDLHLPAHWREAGDDSRRSSYTPVSTVEGALNGRVIYLMAGHGWTYPDGSGVWHTQRPLTNFMVEDFGTIDQATIAADMFLNAGATVVPLRPFGFRAEEVVITNMDPQATFAGTWNNSVQTPYYGNASDSVSYRWSPSVEGTPTAVATYDASDLLPVEGFYPVYVWTRWGLDRINQEYIVNHSGGSTVRRINHQRVGAGWVYLGQFWFEPGGDVSVQITNSRLAGGAGTNAFADSVRWGNGIGTTPIGSETSASNRPRHEENARYWLTESRGQSSGLTLSGSVTAPPRLAAHMTFTGGSDSGSITDRVYLSYHSNASGGRGADGLFNSNPSPPSCSDISTANANNTPNGPEFALEIGRRFNLDLTTATNAPGNPFENTWGRSGLGANTFGSGCVGFNAYGEIRNSNIDGLMAATIIETAFHDNALDSQLMRDPKVRELMADISVRAVVNFFDDFGGGSREYLPEPPTAPALLTDSSGNVTLSWTAPVAGGPWGIGGDAPAGYIVEISENGRGFAPVATVTGGSTTSFDVTPFVDEDELRHFRVIATNDGGHSRPSPVVTVRRGSTESSALIVNGFTRYDRFTNYRQTESAGLGSAGAGGGTFQRVVPRYNNSFDYSVELGEALADHDVHFDMVSRELIMSGAVSMNDYQDVYWILGEQSTADRTFGPTKQPMVEDFLENGGNNGGNLFISGSEIGWDLGRTAASAANKQFLQDTLKTAPFTTDNPEDDAGTYTVQGTPGGLFEGIGPFNFSDGSDIHGKYDVAFPDVLNPVGGAVTAMNYVSPSSSAAIVHEGDANRGRLVFLGFPLEAVNEASVRSDIMGAVVEFFAEETSVSQWYLY